MNSERILAACECCLPPNNYYLPLAIYLAIDTGMRRQEIFNLIWADIDDENRRIRIRKSKTDKVTGNLQGTTIVLPAMAKHLLITLAMIRHRESNLPIEDQSGKYFEMLFPQDDERIFPMTAKAFTQAWKKVLKRAGIENLHFHDLRREANLCFHNAGLTVEERDIMLRHSNRNMDSVYLGRNHLLKVIQDKLDKFVLGGMTYEEALQKNGKLDFEKGRKIHLPIAFAMTKKK